MRVSLDQLKVGERGRIFTINTQEPRIYQKLMNLGLIPGSEVKVLQRSPIYLIQVGFTQMALDRATCQLIQVVINN
ncbi:hypothetical protein BBF96_09385 [Anoxybacter fermentans]|uniref:Ferrous iron transporter FeoA-like domain-containing protein n=1 Tax=Anoxybacter fermentans TaxID=1323375 RepID=A0A3Q9HR86_9FIRM|nr:FeoA family protein [Anoxybacter fermentans]AZR73583.1 hypothetical protein BBF96_09385 [Anoxybacter fermentans]